MSDLANDILSMIKKNNPNAKARIAPSVEQQIAERDALFAKREQHRKENKNNFAKPQHVFEEKYPLGGYDPKSHRSYSD